MNKDHIQPEFVLVITGRAFISDDVSSALTHTVSKYCGVMPVCERLGDVTLEYGLDRNYNGLVTALEEHYGSAKLGITVTPLASQGLLRSNSVELGEDVVVAGFPFGDIFSNTIKITKGVVSAKRGMSNDSGQFQIDAAVQHGSSGGPIYDENGNIVGVVVSQLNKMKFAKATGSIPENVNFGIKASTVRQFLNASGLPTKWSKRSKSMSTRELAKIAKSQTVMVVCHP